MRAQSITVLLIAVALAVPACSIDIDLGSGRVEGSGVITSETRDLDPFDEIVLAGEGTVTLVLGEEPGIEIEGDENLHEFIQTDVRGGTLEIRTRQGFDIQPSDAMRYRVGTGTVERIGLTGAGLIRLDRLDTGDLEVDLTGAGNIEVDMLTADRVDVGITGAGLVRLTGTAVELEIRMSGVGNFDGSELQAAEARIDLPGVGSATLWVTDALDADVSGVGSVSVWGDPTVTGSASVRRLGEK